MKKLLLIALVAAGMTACMQSEELAVPQSEAISFGNAYLDNSVRGEAAADPSTNNDNIANFSVWGFMTSDLGTVLTDETVEKQSNNAWAYANVQYWMPEKDYYFSALSPANGDWDHNEVVAATEGLSNVKFTNEKGKIDLLYAYATAETPAYAELTNNGMPAVTMGFKHTLSKVKFTFANDFKTDNMFVEVKNVEMVVPQSGTVDFYGANENVWNLGNGTTTLAFGDTELISYQDTDECTTELFTIPASADYSYSVKFDLYVYTGKADSKELAFKAEGKEATISGYALEMGKAYNFVASINPSSLNLHEIVFTATVEDWETPTVEVPVGYYVSENGTYVVTTESGLAQIAEEINAGIKTNRNIALSGDLDLNSMRSASNWTPIGTSANPFKGTFDGNGHVIKNLVIDGGSNSYIGLFGNTHNGEIKNLVVENAKVSGRLNVAVVAGQPYTSKYTNITVRGHVEVDGMAYVGAVGGKNAYANWTNITVDVDETSYVNAYSVENGTAYRSYVGGICGFNGEGGHSFTNIYSNINVKGSTIDVGGLFGIAHYGNKFENCVCEGDVEIYAASEEADAQEIGGIAGVWHNGGQDVVFTNCSFTGTLKANNDYVIDTNKFGNLVCAAYNQTGNGALNIDGVKYTVVEGKVLVNGAALVSSVEGVKDALANGETTVALAAGEYTFPASSIKPGVTLNCLEGVVFTGTSSLNVKGATIVGATFKNEGGMAVEGTINGTFKNCTFEGKETIRWCYTSAGETVVFENCVVNTTFRGVHFDVMDGDVIFKDCEINGFNAYSGAGTMTFEGCTFGCDASNYNGLNIYSNTVLKNCTFGYVSGKTNFIDMEGTGKTLTIINCTATLDGAAAEVSDFVGGSKLANNTVIYQ